MNKKPNSHVSGRPGAATDVFVVGASRAPSILAGCLAVWAIALAPLIVHAGEDVGGCGGMTAGSAVALVQDRYDQVADIEADFEQTTYSAMLAGGGLGEESPTHGHMQIAKPGRMRWHYLKPEESLVLSDGETLWIHDVGAGEVTRARVTEGYLAGAALQFLLGEGAIADAFDVTLESCDASGVHLMLMPKEPASYERLGLVVAGDTGVVEGTTIFDLFGNVTRLRFDNLRFDRSPSPDVFKWTQSGDVRVIDLDAASGGSSEPPGGGAEPEARPSSR